MGATGFRLRKSPLVYVLAQIVVNPVANLQKYIDDIQDRLRKAGFIDFKQINAQSLTIEAESNRISLGQKSVWTFMTRDRRTAVIASPDSIVVQTSSYEHFAAFCEKVIQVLSAAHDAIVGGYAVRRRLGLRYVNLIPAEPQGPTVSDLLKPGLLGMSFNKAGVGEAFRRVDTTFPMMGKGLLSVRFSDVPGQPPLPLGIEPFGMEIFRGAPVEGRFGLLDIDRYHDGEVDFDLESIRSDLACFNADAEDAFRQAVTDAALKYWEEESTRT